MSAVLSDAEERYCLAAHEVKLVSRLPYRHYTLAAIAAATNTIHGTGAAVLTTVI